MMHFGGHLVPSQPLQERLQIGLQTPTEKKQKNLLCGAWEFVRICDTFFFVF